MQKHVNLVDLVKSFPTNIFLQNLASTQKRTSPTNFEKDPARLQHGGSRTATASQDTAHAVLLQDPAIVRAEQVGDHEATVPNYVGSNPELDRIFI